MEEGKYGCICKCLIYVYSFTCVCVCVCGIDRETDRREVKYTCTLNT